MNYPINFAFVTSEDITYMRGPGAYYNATVLVLDKKANDDYWKHFHCFAEQINALGLKGPDECECWEMSTAFAGNQGVLDLIVEMRSQPFAVPENMTAEDMMHAIYKIPVNLVEHDQEFLILKLKDGRNEINEYWK